MGVIGVQDGIIKGDVVQGVGPFLHVGGVFVVFQLGENAQTLLRVGEHLVTGLADGVLLDNHKHIGIRNIHKIHGVLVHFLDFRRHFFRVVGAFQVHRLAGQVGIGIVRGAGGGRRGGITGAGRSGCGFFVPGSLVFLGGFLHGQLPVLDAGHILLVFLGGLGLFIIGHGIGRAALIIFGIGAGEVVYIHISAFIVFPELVVGDFLFPAGAVNRFKYLLIFHDELGIGPLQGGLGNAVLVKAGAVSGPLGTGEGLNLGLVVLVQGQAQIFHALVYIIHELQGLPGPVLHPLGAVLAVDFLVKYGLGVVLHQGQGFLIGVGEIINVRADRGGIIAAAGGPRLIL